jgi:putative Mg2+ transporter-C (MgtC) family protein
MPFNYSSFDILIRLAFTVIASGAIGIDRDEQGHTAGLRTNLLVGLAACIAMIQANLLIHSTGKTPDSFVVMDTMRLPLGILSGIGFIGAGAIIKRGEMSVGVTTAATLWFVTVLGLCFGGGQIHLGLIAFILGFAVLNGLKFVEHLIKRQSGILEVAVITGGPNEIDIQNILKRGGVTTAHVAGTFSDDPAADRVYRWDVHWKANAEDAVTPKGIEDLSRHAGIRRLTLSR